MSEGKKESTPALRDFFSVNHQLLASLEWTVCTYIRKDGETQLLFSVLSAHEKLTTATKNPIKTYDCNASTPQMTPIQWERGAKLEGKLVIVSKHFRQLLAYSMSLRNKLIIEFPILAAFRAGEISTFQAEWADCENGDLWLLDSKTLTMCIEPVDPFLGKHIDEYREETGLYHGTLIRADPKAPHKGRKLGSKTLGSIDGLSITHIERLWTKLSVEACGSPLSPRMGRGYKACSMIYGFDPITGEKRPKKSVVCVQHTLRHDDLQSTEHYVSSKHLVNYDDFKAEFLEGIASPFSLSSCSRFGACPLASDGCKCRMFQPSTIEVKTT